MIPSIYTISPKPRPGSHLLKLGIWTIDCDTAGERGFHLSTEDRALLLKLLTLILNQTDFLVLVPVGDATEFDSLQTKYPTRLQLIRPTSEATLADDWLEEILKQPCDVWLCWSESARNAIRGLGALSDAEIVQRFEIFTPGQFVPSLLTANAIANGLAHIRGTKRNPDLWTEEQTRILKLLRQVAPPAPMVVNTRPRPVTLFLSQIYREGVWELVRHLLRELVEINRVRQELDLSLLVVPGQPLDGLDRLEPGLVVDQFEWETFSIPAAIWELGDSFQPYLEGPQLYTLPKAANKAVPAPAALFGLCDRTVLPLLPRMPYGLWIYDLIQEQAPDTFDEQFFRLYKQAMKPTAIKATVAVVPSAAVQAEAEQAYRIPARRMTMIPVACEPHNRFGQLQPQPIPAVNRPYFLFPANAAPHKGAEVVIRALIQLKTMQADPPLLVQCGFHTEQFSASATAELRPHHKKIQEIVSKAGLIEGQDLLFLGNVSEAELKALYQNALAVINAAKFDNGSFNIVEGHYFGLPIISSDYPGARELAKRFNLPVRFFARDNFVALARELLAVQSQPRLQGVELESVRHQLVAPEYSVRMQAERFYQVLMELSGHSASRGA